MSEEIEAHIHEVVRNHSTGNAQFKIDQWVDHFDMRAVPAFNSNIKGNESWTNYLKGTTFENLEAVKQQHERIGTLLNQVKKVKPRYVFSDGKTTASKLVELYGVCDEMLRLIPLKERLKANLFVENKLIDANKLKCERKE